MKKKKEVFNVRQQKYKNNVLIGMSKYNAAIAAGYSESTARSHIKDLEKRIAMPDVLEQQGLTDQVLTHKLIQLMEATKVMGYLHNYKKGSKGGIEDVSPDEVISNEFVDVPDWTARAKGLELALKLKGVLRDKVDHAVAVTYNKMAMIMVKEKPLNLDLGEIPQAIKDRL